MSVAGRDESRVVNLLTNAAERLDDRLPRGEEVGRFGEEWELSLEAGCFHFALSCGKSQSIHRYWACSNIAKLYQVL